MYVQTFLIYFMCFFFLNYSSGFKIFIISRKNCKCFIEIEHDSTCYFRATNLFRYFHKHVTKFTSTINLYSSSSNRAVSFKIDDLNQKSKTVT